MPIGHQSPCTRIQRGWLAATKVRERLTHGQVDLDIFMGNVIWQNGVNILPERPQRELPGAAVDNRAG
ncbi:hypothetical protein ACJ73_02694, partial [Blastomyces percursus]